MDVNCETQIQTVREMNDVEYANYLEVIARYEAEHPAGNDSVV
jgi:hypothetical protein